MSHHLRSGYVPGIIGRVTELHASYYSRFWNFGAIFEAQVASGLAEFFNRYDEKRDRFLSLVDGGTVQGSICIDGLKAETEGAHLRWFILSADLRGRGHGRRLLEEAILFCRERKYGRVYLWTFEGLLAARHLYESSGFRLVHQAEGSRYGTRVVEQKLELREPDS